MTATHDTVSQCWRALHEEDVGVDKHPSSAPDPLILEAADPVITHSVTLPRDRTMGRSTASHAGSLPKVPPSGRPPDRNDRPHGGANNCAALSARHDSAEPTSAPTEAPTASPSNPYACTAPLVLEPVWASVCNTGSNRNGNTNHVTNAAVGGGETLPNRLFSFPPTAGADGMTSGATALTVTPTSPPSAPAARAWRIRERDLSETRKPSCPMRLLPHPKTFPDSRAKRE